MLVGPRVRILQYLFSLPETVGMREALEPLMLEHRVTAVVAAHFHQYERSCPVANGVCGDGGSLPVYLTTGIAGLQSSAGWLGETPEWVVVQDDRLNGYARFDAVNATHLHVRAIDAFTDEAVDEFWLLA